MSFSNKSILIVLSILILSGCSLTQPSAPLYNGLENVKHHQSKKLEKRKAHKLQVKEKASYKESVKEIKKEKKIYHTVKPGEYVYSIARRYKVSPQEIIKNNELKRPYYLEKGDKLFIKTETIIVKEIQKNPLKKMSKFSFTNKYFKGKKDKPVLKSLPKRDLSRKNSDKYVDFGYHKVKRGETLFRISKKYDVSVFDLMAYNDLDKPQDLKSGMEIKIPVAKHDIPLPEEKVQQQQTTSLLTVPFIDKKKSRKRGFVRPVNGGRIIQKFGVQGHGVRNDGIDIAVPMNTPVVAAESGTVKYAQDLGTVGKMILIKHSNGYITAYTHNNKLLVKKGQKVTKGQTIAFSGNSGIAKQPMLHFELRRYGKARNPLKYIK